jgi:HlyD family type I secretion membrane fusion protein
MTTDRAMTFDAGRTKAQNPERAEALLRGRYAEFLPGELAVARRRHSPLAGALVVVIALVFLVVVLWAALAKVEEVATAPGQVRPAGRVKVINHPDGGRVAALFAEEGQKIELGQVLLEFDAGLLEEEIANVTGEWQGLLAAVARLDAEAAFEDVTFPDHLLSARPDLVLTQLQLYNARAEGMGSRRAATDKVIEQRQSEVAQQDRRVSQLEQSLAIVREQEAAVAQLIDKGYFPRLRYLSLQREISELAGETAQAKSARHAAIAALSEAGAERRRIDEEWRAAVLSDLADRRAERDRARSAMHQLRQRLEHLSVRAPVSGIVRDLSVRNIGQAVEANRPLVNIVPTDDRPVIEAKVPDHDIGHIELGQTVTVKVRTYDFLKFGTLEGTVEQIAADAAIDDKTGATYFNVLVRTDRARLGSGPGARAINPGMLVDVDFHVGERSILSYLTDRVTQTTRGAFREP